MPMALVPHIHKKARHSTTAVLVGATLLTSAVHFVDNAFRLDLYPGPVWLTRNGVLLAWMAVLVLACSAYWSATRAGLAAYGLLGFAGFAHYLVPHHHTLPLRCAVTILGEAIASLALIAYVLSRGPFERPG
jgi:hypothetical protein